MPATTSMKSMCSSTRLRVLEWGPARNDADDPRHPEMIAEGIERLVAVAGCPDDN